MMTSHELARQLLAGPDLPVELRIENPKDTAYTRAEIGTKLNGDSTHIEVSGWVASDDKDAFAPWINYDEED